jgi:hypothetical protein
LFQPTSTSVFFSAAAVPAKQETCIFWGDVAHPMPLKVQIEKNGSTTLDKDIVSRCLGSDLLQTMRRDKVDHEIGIVLMLEMLMETLPPRAVSRNLPPPPCEMQNEALNFETLLKIYTKVFFCFIYNFSMHYI